MGDSQPKASSCPAVTPGLQPNGTSMKIAVAGKGGSGKTTVAGTLARTLARQGYRVLAIDADPAPNLAITLGIPRELAEGINSIPRDLLERRTGVPEIVRGQNQVGLTKLGPQVATPSVTALRDMVATLALGEHGADFVRELPRLFDRRPQVRPWAHTSPLARWAIRTAGLCPCSRAAGTSRWGAPAPVDACTLLGCWGLSWGSPHSRIGASH